jgi:hypothetical protein
MTGTSKGTRTFMFAKVRVPFERKMRQAYR